MSDNTTLRVGRQINDISKLSPGSFFFILDRWHKETDLDKAELAMSISISQLHGKPHMTYMRVEEYFNQIRRYGRAGCYHSHNPLNSEWRFYEIYPPNHFDEKMRKMRNDYFPEDLGKAIEYERDLEIGKEYYFKFEHHHFARGILTKFKINGNEIKYEFKDNNGVINRDVIYNFKMNGFRIYNVKVPGNLLSPERKQYRNNIIAREGNEKGLQRIMAMMPNAAMERRGPLLLARHRDVNNPARGSAKGGRRRTKKSKSSHKRTLKSATHKS